MSCSTCRWATLPCPCCGWSSSHRSGSASCWEESEFPCSDWNHYQRSGSVSCWADLHYLCSGSIGCRRSGSASRLVSLLWPGYGCRAHTKSGSSSRGADSCARCFDWTHDQNVKNSESLQERLQYQCSDWNSCPRSNSATRWKSSIFLKPFRLLM